MGQNPVTTSTRRNLLTRATFLVGGAWLGWMVRGSEAKAASVAPSAPSAGTKLELRGRHMHLQSQSRKRGVSSAARKRTTGAEQKWATGSAIGAEGWPVSAMRLGFGRRAAGR